MTAQRADGLLHPVPLACIALLVLNDHVWKTTYGTWWTGKLSDVAGMVFFPLLLQAMVEIADRREPFVARRRVLLACAGATAAVFAATNLFGWAAEVYRVGLGWIQWPFRCALAWEWVTARPVHHTMDPTDVIAAPFVTLGVWVGWKRSHWVAKGKSP